MLDLDHNATTPLDERVLEAMLPFLRHVYGNPSSAHGLGRQARAALDEARGEVARAIGAGPGQIVFTGGGSEANSLALLGGLPLHPRGRSEVVLGAAEHPSVLEAREQLEERGYQVRLLPVDGVGRIRLDLAREWITEATAMVSVQMANNEVGTLQPIAELAARTRECGAWLHTDAVQALGKLPIDVHALGVDLLTLSAHKVYGPKGVGALWLRDEVKLRPLVVGGPQEDRRRAGTENVAGIIGFARACALFRDTLEQEAQRQRALRDRLEATLREQIPGIRFHGDRQAGLPNTLSLSLPGLAGDELLILLDLRGVRVSTGSACSSGSMKPSHVLSAMGLEAEEARRVVRISLGRGTTEADLEPIKLAFSASLRR